MQDTGWRGRVPGIVFLAIVVVAIGALIAGFGAAVGVGALVGLVLGTMAGVVLTLWLARGPGRAVSLAGVSWTDPSQADPATFHSELDQLTEVLGIDLGPIRSILPVLATVEANGLAVQLVAIEVHEAGANLTVDVRVLPGSPPLSPSLVQVTLSDRLGTPYRASGHDEGGDRFTRLRYEVAVIPAPPPAVRELSIRIDRFVGLLPGERRATVGPWVFDVTLPTGDG